LQEIEAGPEGQRAVSGASAIVAKLRDEGLLSYADLSSTMSERSRGISKWDVKQVQLQLDGIEGKALDDADARAELLRPLLAKLRAQGISSNADLARALKEADIPNPQGGVGWHSNTVRALLAPKQPKTISAKSEQFSLSGQLMRPSAPISVAPPQVVTLGGPKAEPASRRPAKIFGLLVVLGLGSLGIYWASHQMRAPTSAAAPAVAMEPLSAAVVAAAAEPIVPPSSEMIVTSRPIIKRVLPAMDAVPPLIANPPQTETEQASSLVPPTSPHRKARAAPEISPAKTGDVGISNLIERADFARR
jgi:hypothetical protein